MKSGVYVLSIEDGFYDDKAFEECMACEYSCEVCRNETECKSCDPDTFRIMTKVINIWLKFEMKENF